MARKLLFVLADGGRARLIERSPVAVNDFVTVEQIDNAEPLRQLRAELRASPPVRTHDSVGPGAHAVGPEDFIRPAKEAFIAQVADRVAEAVRRGGLEAVVLAAPSRLIGVLRDELQQRVEIAGEIRKDLTNTPDHELGAWLREAGR